MNKKLLAILFAFTLVFAFAAPFTYAANNDKQPKHIRGRIRNANGTGAGGASVVVSCNATTQNTTAAGNGRFDVIFPVNTCVSGNTVTVVGSKDGNSGSRSIVITNGLNHNIGDVILSAAAVPEFGMITGSMAVIGSLSSIYLLKKKQRITS